MPSNNATQEEMLRSASHTVLGGASASHLRKILGTILKDVGKQAVVTGANHAANALNQSLLGSTTTPSVPVGIKAETTPTGFDQSSQPPRKRRIGGGRGPYF